MVHKLHQGDILKSVSLMVKDHTQKTENEYHLLKFVLLSLKLMSRHKHYLRWLLLACDPAADVD